MQQTEPLFDHLVGGNEQLVGHSETEHPGGLVVDDQFELARLHNRQVRGLGPLEEAAGIDTGLTPRVLNVGTIAHQPAHFGNFTRRICRGNRVARRQVGKLHPPEAEKRVGANQERIRPLAHKSCEGCILRIFVSVGSRALIGVSSTAWGSAIAWITANWPIPGPRVESRSTATRVTRGAISLNNSSHFPARLYSNWVKPVTLPPGRAMLSTKPDPSGSMTCVNTIGVVGAACSIGASTTLLGSRITSGARAASSAASFWVRAGLKAPQRYSMRILRPTVQPEVCSACSNAARRATDSGSSSARATITPMHLIRSVCCAPAASGQTAAPPSSPMKTRLFIRSPRRRGRARLRECRGV